MLVEETDEQSLIQLSRLAQNNLGQSVVRRETLAQSGSHRRYYRLLFADHSTCIGAYNQDVAENRAFFAYTRKFGSLHFNVPQLFSIAADEQHYLQSDLGNETLYDFLCAHRTNDMPSPQVIDYYEQAVRALPLFQLAGHQDFDFSMAYPRAAFDRQSMQWDLNYFKYYFLKLVNIPFHEQALENDYNTLIDYLLTADCSYFLYRDFQSRNLMVHEGKVFFIDYQGGRKGALPYDIASLLYDAKADLSSEMREHLLKLYIKILSRYSVVDEQSFMAYYQGYVLIRILQSMGTYGYRGYFEHKVHFLQSVPYAARNLANLLQHLQLPVALPELTRVLRQIVQSDFVHPYLPTPRLTVLIQSFSFKAGIPQDPTPNGGGFVFDCRALPNPGREKKFARNTGKDVCVVDYLSQFQSIKDFEDHVFTLVDQSVENYIQRQFSHLMVSFGCTGGQHRSVFFAEQLAHHLHDKFPTIDIELKHTELIKNF